MYQLTLPSDLSFCQKIAYNINKDYPNVARIMPLPTTTKAFVVMVENSYWSYCNDYVEKHCKIKAENE